MGRIALGVADRTALIEQFTDIDREILTDHDVIPAGTERISWLHNHALGIAGVASDLQPTDHPIPMEVPVMQFVFLDKIGLEPVEVLVGQQLTGEKPRPTEALKATTG